MRVAGTHKSIRQPRAVLFRILQPPLPFHLGVELLQIVLRELVQRYMSDGRDNMIVDNVLLAVFRRFAERGLTIGLIPKIYPLTKGHVRFEPFHRLAELVP